MQGEYVIGGPGGDSWTSDTRDLFADLFAVAFNATTGAELWAYQDTGRDPFTDWSFKESSSWLRGAVYDASTGLLVACGETVGCLGYGCTYTGSNNNADMTILALDASTGDLVWHLQV